MTKEMQALQSICKLYEFEIELIQPWHARVFYFDEQVFDFYPKNARLCDLSEKNFKKAWHTLDKKKWKKQIHKILGTYIFCEKLYIDFKEPSFEEKVRRILATIK